jgi:CRP-like cAMP-binding protein
MRRIAELRELTMANNTLLSLLSCEASHSIQDCLESNDLSPGQVLYEPYRPIRYVYFHCGGLASEIITDQDEQTIEVGCAGREGLSGVPVILGMTSSPHRACMEIGGPALRIQSSQLQDLMDESAELRGLLLRYAHVFMTQMASTALAVGRYDVDRRLARWLLMAHDRVEGDELQLTHDFFALMLGVRRSGITDATHKLEGDGLIKATRGRVLIKDRSGLEARAGGSYGFSEAEYRRVLLNDAQPRERASRTVTSRYSPDLSVTLPRMDRRSKLVAFVETRDSRPSLLPVVSLSSDA